MLVVRIILLMTAAYVEAKVLIRVVVVEWNITVKCNQEHVIVVEECQALNIQIQNLFVGMKQKYVKFHNVPQIQTL